MAWQSRHPWRHIRHGFALHARRYKERSANSARRTRERRETGEARMTTGAVTRPQATSPEEELIPRYSFLERINHWLGALAYTYLLITCLPFCSPYLFCLVTFLAGCTLPPLFPPS